MFLHRAVLRGAECNVVYGLEGVKLHVVFSIPSNINIEEKQHIIDYFTRLGCTFVKPQIKANNKHIRLKLDLATLIRILQESRIPLELNGATLTIYQVTGDGKILAKAISRLSKRPFKHFYEKYIFEVLEILTQNNLLVRGK